MIIRVLGSAAGGGFPQWNCNCRNCAAVRAGDRQVVARTQTSLAASLDGERWVVLDASPDLCAQIAASTVLQPRPGHPHRSTPIGAIVVTGFEVDQVGGLLNLREGQPFQLYGTSFVLESLQSNPIFQVLAPGIVSRRRMTPGRPFEPFESCGFEILPVAVSGKLPLHSVGEREQSAHYPVGLVLRDAESSRRFAYVPSCARITDGLLREIADVDVLFFDGTLFSDLELAEQGLSQKTGVAMGHISMSGADGAIANLRSLSIPRRIFIHLNNSNPVLRDDSSERAFVTAAGWEVAYDGMEIRL